MKQCACGTEIERHRRVCDACQDAKKKENNAKIQAKRATGYYQQSRWPSSKERVTHAYAQVEQVKPWEPKPKPPPLLTWEQQREIDKAVDAARLARSGMDTFDRGRSIPREEWDAILSTIRPIHLIRREPLQPLVLNGGI